MDLIQLKTRPVVIRRELFDHYSELGLDEQDLVILIKLLYASETSVSYTHLTLPTNREV